ncbi:MAG: addiction module toxin, HicA family [Acidobacteriia bacterium]|nr:addiction module toxin, HicA family [Terriglobia bacterium]MYB53295.1 addiction module toxin, HicA family [Terriglobia bacterium]MYC66079.1 addiction module toxin, HicA family [Terriglobia bacterium]MYG01257.1 addiction module toxin, HicA family [Terriglobia bacterium]MYK11521.1 addiction module toxin, HicA family [Terriglobia bacterium]
MARLPVLSGDDFTKIVARIGFSLDRTEGSHMILIGPTGRRLSVPKHRELGRGLLRALIRDAGLTRDEFLRLAGQR